jgi:two-component system OmpR family response regulator
VVVDDDRKFADLLARALPRAGHECWTASTGCEGAELIGRVEPDVAVLDVMVPPPDGYELCGQLRADDWPGGIVIVTACHGAAERRRAHDAGADDFLGKPFRLADLIAIVDELAAGRRGPGGGRA